MRYYARVTEVVDSDTLRLEIDTGLDVSVSLTCELYGVKVKDESGAGVVGGLLSQAAWECKVTTVRDKREVYGRFKVKLYVPQMTEDDPNDAHGGLMYVNKYLIDHGYAEPVDGEEL